MECMQLYGTSSGGGREGSETWERAGAWRDFLWDTKYTAFALLLPHFRHLRSGAANRARIDRGTQKQSPVRFLNFAPHRISYLASFAQPALARPKFRLPKLPSPEVGFLFRRIPTLENLKNCQNERIREFHSGVSSITENFQIAFVRVFRKNTTFSARSSRTEIS